MSSAPGLGVKSNLPIATDTANGVPTDRVGQRMDLLTCVAQREPRRHERGPDVTNEIPNDPIGLPRGSLVATLAVTFEIGSDELLFVTNFINRSWKKLRIFTREKSKGKSGKVKKSKQVLGHFADGLHVA